MADFLEFRITDNADWTFAFRVDQDGEPKDLSAATLEMDIRTSADAASEMASLTIGDGLALGTGRGEVAVTFEAGLLDPGSYVTDLVATIAGRPQVLGRGTVKVDKGVTRA